MALFGLLITKDDDSLAEDWFRENANLFDEIVCLDGSSGDATRSAAAKYSNVIHLHEHDWPMLQKTDHGLRDLPYQLIAHRHGVGHWITLCHMDEFFYHDPRECCKRAEREGADSICWFVLHFLPHPSDLTDTSRVSSLSPCEWQQWFHWDYQGSGEPWVEFRSFRSSADVYWIPNRHFSCKPEGSGLKIASFKPTLRHYKLPSINMDDFEQSTNGMLFKRRWMNVSFGRTGVPWLARDWKELFVDSYDGFLRCDQFTGKLDYHWNIGEEYRPKLTKK